MLLRRAMLAAFAATWIGLGAGSAQASQVDTWQGIFILDDVTDIGAFPHRALDYAGYAHLVWAKQGDFTTGTRDGEDDEMRFAGWVGDYISDSITIGCSVGDPRNYAPVASYLDPHARRVGAGLRDGNDLRSLSSLAVGVEPNDQLQATLGWALNDDARLGFSFARGFDEFKTETDPIGGGPTVTTSEEAGYITLGASAGFVMDSFLRDLDVAANFTTGSQKEEDIGDGDTGGFAFALQSTLGDINRWTPRIQAGYWNYNSDFTQDLAPGDPGPALKDEVTVSGWTADFGGSVQLGDRARVVTSVGVMQQKIEFETNDDFTYDNVKQEQTSTLLPTCSAGVSVDVSDHWTFDFGALGAYETVEQEETDDVPGDSQTITQNFVEMTMRYRAGIRYHRGFGADEDGDGEGDTNFVLSATLEPGIFGENPIGGSGNSGDDQPWVEVVSMSVFF
jgi:hypothetical protein